MNPLRIKNVAMVIAEKGSAWTPWVERFRAQCDDVIVVLQERGETVGDLATRVRAKVEELEELEVSLRDAVIVGGGRIDADAMSARSLAIRAVVSPMVRASGGQLLLDSKGPDRYSMMGLASTVASMLRGTGVLVAPADQVPALAGLAA